MALTYWGDPEKSPSSDVHSKLGFRSRAQRGMYTWWMGATRSNLCPCKGQSTAEAISASIRQANLGGSRSAIFFVPKLLVSAHGHHVRLMDRISTTKRFQPLEYKT